MELSMGEEPAVAVDVGDEPLQLDDPAAEEPGRDLDWWHRDHPTFTALTGFFTGLVLVTAAPGAFFATIAGIFGERTAEEAFPFVLLLLAVPIALLTFPPTRRFGKYLLLGMAVTMLVIFGVGTLVFWLMLRSA